MAGKLRTPGVLASGSAAGGVLAYVFFAIVTRSLGAAAAAPVSVLWAYWSFAGAALTFPLQHWIARTCTAHGGEQAVRHAIGKVMLAVVAVSAATSAVSFVARELLFRRPDAAFPILVGAVTFGSGAMGLLRGTLSARRRFGSLAMSLTAENGLRAVAAGILAWRGDADAGAYGAALVLGYAVAVCWPGAFRLGRDGRAAPSESALAFLGTAGGGQLIGQAVLTGGPVLLAAAGGAPAEITALFAGLALFRAPYTLALGVTASLTEKVTDLVVRRRRAELRRLRHVMLTSCGTVLVLAVTLGGWLGPPVVSAVFGADVALAYAPTALVAAGTVCALGNLVATIIVMAYGRPGSLIVCWAVALLPGAVAFATVPGGALLATCVGFAVVEAVAFAAFLLVVRRAEESLDPAPRP